MNPSSPQLNLIDIIEPEAISSWPLAWGWWVLIIASLVCLVLLTYVGISLFKQHKVRSLALQLLDQAKHDYAQSGDNNNYCRDVNKALKRYWRYYRPDSDINALSGKRWVEQLNMQCSTAIFTHNLAIALSDGPYCELKNFNPTALEAAAKRWIKDAQISQLKDVPGGVNV